ncbi:alpha/beta fold hydrolase [Actinocrispum wychmicini]|uniref:alpha/beta fold hydrolase n=1 Tax=Actinocrispum wychmicini TaxID=1213861 RepID=UPI001FB7F66D|nr:alpha/beta fold hydrolase [Actinocrispum wychmicini]
MSRFPAQEAGPPVLLVHGFASDGHTDWITTGWPAALTAQGRRVIVPDLPGHGSSPAPKDATAATAKAMLDELARAVGNVSEVDVIGYSLGARLAWDLPTLLPVRRMVLGGISPVEPFGALDLTAVMAFTTGGKLSADPLTAAISRMISAPGRDPIALCRCIEGLRVEPFAPTALDLPVLFVRGEEDPISQGIETLVDLVPGSELVVVPGDHGGCLRGARFKAAALEFLEA